MINLRLPVLFDSNLKFIKLESTNFNCEGDPQLRLQHEDRVVQGRATNHRQL